MSRRIVGPLAAGGLVACWALTTLGGQFDITLPGALDDLWYSAARLVLVSVVGLACAFAVGRWWILLAAGTPVAVLGGLQLAGHVAPWHDAYPPLQGFWYYGGPLWLALFYVLPLVVGVGARKGTGGAAHAAGLTSH